MGQVLEATKSELGEEQNKSLVVLSEKDARDKDLIAVRSEMEVLRKTHGEAMGTVIRDRDEVVGTLSELGEKHEVLGDELEQRTHRVRIRHVLGIRL